MLVKKIFLKNSNIPVTEKEKILILSFSYCYVPWIQNTLKWLRKKMPNPEGWEVDLHCSESINVLTQESSAIMDGYWKWLLLSLIFLNVPCRGLFDLFFPFILRALRKTLETRWHCSGCVWGYERCCHAEINWW